MRAPSLARLFRMPPSAGLLIRQALPSAITIAGLCFGLTGLTFAAAQDFPAAIGCVLIAALLDACDGQVARAAGVASRFGAELDSLSDAICFGAVPAFILHQWGLSAFGPLGWMACLAVAAACCLRLARFNMTSHEPGRPSWMQHYFTGVPAPAGAFLALLPIYANQGQAAGAGFSGLLALAASPIVAGLMVSTLPTLSAKALSRKALRLFFLPSLALAAAFGLGLVFQPWPTLALAAAAYLLTLPFSLWRYNVLHRRSSQ